MLIKIKDYRFVASEVSYFNWQKGCIKEHVMLGDTEIKEGLLISLKNDNIIIEGPKTLLDDFEKQYNEIMGTDFGHRTRITYVDENGDEHQL